MFTLNCRGRLLSITQPVVMGIINTTPDSFFSGSRQQTIEGALHQAEKMISEGAVILDIGGQSTRPGSEQVTAQTEAERVLPVIEALHHTFPGTVLSVDTYYASVAEKAVAAGASVINDISGGMLDAAMLPTAAKLQTPFICMHMKGTPQTMQQFTQYENIVQEVLEYFIERIAACRLAGITDIIIDPGFGFSKTIAQNFELLRGLSVLSMLEKPILAGLSRKGTVYKTLQIQPEEALNGTTVLNTVSLLNGASILRVHDVKEAAETIKLVQAYYGEK
ncbi:dihydropteroate synthase [Panacibacter sp. DH6]|uniref:dihydropteroate synthase n=1 Tax=Panacibacter microcysteis TaxID=2793269 RepID=A0A931GZW6_9BACT|nr:dihydropteroate synthase [Panacibacter microcysteis]MBG9378437.1 dihydropteroate synthase [Panacibacter microcysteis]